MPSFYPFSFQSCRIAICVHHSNLLWWWNCAKNRSNRSNDCDWTETLPNLAKWFVGVAGPEAGRIREVPGPRGEEPSGERKRKRRKWRRSPTWSTGGRSSPYPGIVPWRQSPVARARCPHHGIYLFTLFCNLLFYKDRIKFFFSAFFFFKFFKN